MDRKPTINFVTAGFMLGAAILIDAMQALLTLSVLLIPLSLFLTLVAAIIFNLWFFLLGAYTGKGAEKKVMVSALSTITEFIPVISIVPAVTAGVLANILLSRADDLKKRIGTDPRKAAAVVRLQRMNASRGARAESARQTRETTQQERHAPANDNDSAAETSRAA